MNYFRKSNLSGFNILALFFATVFFTWSIFAFANMFWNFDTDWVGFIWLGLSMLIFFRQARFINARKKSKMVFRELMLHPNDSIEEVALYTGVPLNIVKEVVVDLKLRGILRSSFNTHTGHMENVHLVSSIPRTSSRHKTTETFSQPTIQNYAKHEELEFTEEVARFCSYCGTKLNPGVSKYCEFCGQAI
ncbi:MAG: hypothetical protein ACW99E_20275 [Promethearchaeota archaeon]|jgi:hypothetical protein